MSNYDNFITIMKIQASNTSLSGHICVPGSKSHTIRALLLASISGGECHIFNPLPSADCLSTAKAIPLLGSTVELGLSIEDNVGSEWIVYGAGEKLHLPEDVVNVGDSGSLLYFLSPIAATFDGWTVFTGDASIRKRPVHHVVDAIKQLGGEAYITRPDADGCPLVVKGPISTKNKIVTGGTVSSQYVSGIMMSALLMKGTMEIELTDPKETPYLVMTQKWLEKVGAKVTMSEDFKHITVTGPEKINAFNATIPSDWEGVAFPMIAALITDSDITIDNIDGSGTQGDEEIVNVLKSIGADITWNREKENIRVKGKKKSSDGIGRLTTENLPGGELHVNLSGYPDAICAVSVIACFTEGTTVIEDIAMCRRKETDRIVVMKEMLERLGATVEEGPDYMIIHGHSPVLADGSENPEFKIHGGEVESYDDHRVAMSLACLGLGLKTGNTVTVADAECCSVSFPYFYDVMNEIGAKFKNL